VLYLETTGLDTSEAAKTRGIMSQRDTDDFSTSQSAINNECSIADEDSDILKSKSSVIQGKYEHRSIG